MHLSPLSHCCESFFLNEILECPCSKFNSKSAAGTSMYFQRSLLTVLGVECTTKGQENEYSGFC